MSWEGKFGKEYTDRNLEPVDYEKRYGLSRRAMNSRFLDNLSRKLSILEVGCNVGNQLLILKEMGFTKLHGIDSNEYAVNIARERGLNATLGSALDIQGKFNLVFTSGLLIHINPNEIERVMCEIYKASKRYIWGFEYYSPSYQEINYRGHENMLWKADFSNIFRDILPLKLIKEERFKYLDSDNVDTMFLLEKR